MSTLDQFKLDGKIALVTGCKRGLGRAMAQALAEAGADIIGVSRSLEASGSDIEQDVQKAGQRFWAYTCDFSDRQAVYDFIGEVNEKFPRVDILVNNAGIILRKPAAEHPDSYWDEVVEINLSVQFILAREFGKAMLSRGEGKILFTASVLSFQGGVAVPGYSATKGAIAQLIMALANEWAGRGVNVNGIAPGYIKTDINTQLQTDPERNRQITQRIPAGRWGVPDDVKGATIFLCSKAANYVHGTLLTVDGGWMGR